MEERNTSGPRLKVLSQNMAARFHKTSEIIGPHKGGIWNYMQRHLHQLGPGTYKTLNYILHIFSGWQRRRIFFRHQQYHPSPNFLTIKRLGWSVLHYSGWISAFFFPFLTFPANLWACLNEFAGSCLINPKAGIHQNGIHWIFKILFWGIISRTSPR